VLNDPVLDENMFKKVEDKFIVIIEPLNICRMR